MATENIRQGLARLTRSLVPRRFLRWWLGELSALLPAWLRGMGPDLATFPPVGLMPGALMLYGVEQGRLVERRLLSLTGAADTEARRTELAAALDGLQPGQREVVLAVPAGQILRRTLSLPLATEENLRQVLEFQIEQLTPFTVAQVHFGHRVLERDFERGTLRVELTATPRQGVDEALNALASWGGSVRGVVAQDTLPAGAPVHLLPGLAPRPRAVFMRGAAPWFGVLVLLLALAALALPVVIKREASIALLPWVDKARRAAEATDALRREVEARVEQRNLLPARKREVPPVIASIEELARILPDDTWVQQMDIKGKTVQIQGETGGSSRLVGLFEQSPLFGNASFRSPLTKGNAPGTERYHLALDVRAPAPPASAASATAVAPRLVASSPATSPGLAASGPATPAAVAVSVPLASASTPVRAPAASSAGVPAPRPSAPSSAPAAEKKP